MSRLPDVGPDGSPMKAELVVEAIEAQGRPPLVLTQEVLHTFAITILLWKRWSS